MLITATSGGAGLNISAASHAILSEPGWKKSNEAQLVDRLQCLGQLKIVHVWSVICWTAAIDRLLKEMIERKFAVVQGFMAPLQRLDTVPPCIPRQFKGATGEI